MPTDTQVNDLKINVLTEAQYEQIQSPSSTELYLVPETVDTTPTSGSTNPITSGGVYNALQNIPTEMFLCTFTSNNGTYSMDKTPEEIYQAVVASKKIAICKFNAQIFYCYYAMYDNNSYTIKFSQIQITGTTGHFIAYIWNTGNTWYYKSGNLQSQLVDSGANQNIKTINGNSLLGSGDLTIGGVTIYSGSTTPSPSTGSDGDIYIQTVS